MMATGDKSDAMIKIEINFKQRITSNRISRNNN